jgi:hypothetical protein
MNILNSSLEEYKKINIEDESPQSYKKFQQRLKTFDVIITTIVTLNIPSQKFVLA